MSKADGLGFADQGNAPPTRCPGCKVEGALQGRAMHMAGCRFEPPALPIPVRENEF